MGIYIKGMEMPCCCKECIMWNNESSLYGGCLAVSEREGIFDGKTNMEVRQPYCPLVPIPPHGRLIDAETLWAGINKICDRRDAGIISDLTCLQQILPAVRHAPTIIPAEEDEE